MPILTGKRILVTGGGGFIGSNLCEALLKADNNVVCLDNFSTGKRENIEQLKKHSEFKFVQGDICELRDVKKVMAGAEIVLHQAALGSVPRSIHDPMTTNKVNVNGFLTILEAAKQFGVKRVVYASSSSVYGDTQDSPKVEGSLGHQLSPYAVSKRTNELYARVFSELYDLELIGLRYFNVFGRRQRPDGAYAAAIPKFISALMHGIQPEIYGDGEQTRDFTYIDNVIQANKLAATTDNPAAFGEKFNVACGASVTVNEVVAQIKSALLKQGINANDIKAKYLEPRIGDVRSSLADISKIREMLGYEPTHSFEKGMSEAIEWYVEHLKRG